MQKIIVFLLIAGFAAWWTASHHVVRTGRGVVVLQKRFLTYADTYVDVREFSTADFDRHPELKRAMIDGGYRDMLADLKTRELKADFDRAMSTTQSAVEDIAAAIKKIVDAWVSEPQAATAPGRGDVPAIATNQPAPAAQGSQR